MKRITTTLFLTTALVYSASAQITLPYTCGFDNNAQNADWLQYRKGITMIDGNEANMWEPYSSPGAASGPNFLSHHYPTANSTGNAVDDWLVTENINLAGGAKLSLKAWVNAFGGGNTPADSAEIYILKGNRDPALATGRIKIASLRNWATTAGTYNAPVWRDTANVNIPATQGLAYLAFRYHAVDNWFTVVIDNLNITANPTGAAHVNTTATQFRIYPNPAASVVKWEIYSDNIHELQQQEGTVFNTLGQEVARFAVKDGALDIDFLQAGMYYMKIGNAVVPFTRQ